MQSFQDDHVIIEPRTNFDFAGFKMSAAVINERDLARACLQYARSRNHQLACQAERRW